jgi:hypothetical protein
MPLKSPEQALSRVLAADPVVALVVGHRVYPLLAPADAPLPFATWRRGGVIREQSLAGPTNMPKVQAVFDFYAETYEAVRDLADKARSRLDGYGGESADSVLIHNVSLETEVDGFVQLAGSETPPVYSVTQTYLVMWSEQ